MDKNKAGNYFIWFTLVLAIAGIFAVMTYQFVEEKKHLAFEKEVIDFRNMEWAILNEKETYMPGDVILIEWGIDPIEWDNGVVANVTYDFYNEDNDRIYFPAASARIFVDWGKVQYQSSEEVKFSNLRRIEAPYTIPANAADGTYELRLCQKFETSGYTTKWGCVNNGPKFTVTNDTQAD